MRRWLAKFADTGSVAKAPTLPVAELYQMGTYLEIWRWPVKRNPKLPILQPYGRGVDFSTWTEEEQYSYHYWFKKCPPRGRILPGTSEHQMVFRRSQNLGEVRLLLNAALGVLSQDSTLYHAGAMLIGRKMAIPLVENALVCASRLLNNGQVERMYNHIQYALSLLQLCTAGKYGNVIRILVAEHLDAANDLCGALIRIAVINLARSKETPMSEEMVAL